MTTETTVPPGDPTWRKATASGQDTNCVTVRRDLAAVRDSKHPGAILAGDVAALVAAVKAGRIV